MMLSPCGAAYSLDAGAGPPPRDARRAADHPLGAAAASRSSSASIYFDHGRAQVQRVRPGWAGTAIHYVLFNHEVGQFNLEWLADYPVLISVLTLAALWSSSPWRSCSGSGPAAGGSRSSGVMLHAGDRPPGERPALRRADDRPSTSCSSPPTSSIGSSACSIPGLVRPAVASELEASRRSSTRPLRLPGWRQLELASRPDDEPAR